MKNQLLEDKLQEGDVLLFGKPSPIGVIISFMTKSPYTHTAIYIGNGQMIESSWKGVYIADIEKYHNYPTSGAYRHPDATTEQLDKAIKWTKDQIGCGYDYLGLVGIGLSLIRKEKGNKFDNKNKYWCSELVADAYLQSDIKLNVNPKTYLVSPGDLERNLMKVI